MMPSIIGLQGIPYRQQMFDPFRCARATLMQVQLAGGQPRLPAGQVPLEYGGRREPILRIGVARRRPALLVNVDRVRCCLAHLAEARNVEKRALDLPNAVDPVSGTMPVNVHLRRARPERYRQQAAGAKNTAGLGKRMQIEPRH